MHSASCVLQSHATFPAPRVCASVKLAFNASPATAGRCEALSEQRRPLNSLRAQCHLCAFPCHSSAFTPFRSVHMNVHSSRSIHSLQIQLEECSSYAFPSPFTFQKDPSMGTFQDINPPRIPPSFSQTSTSPFNILIHYHLIHPSTPSYTFATYPQALAHLPQEIQDFQHVGIPLENTCILNILSQDFLLISPYHHVFDFS